MLMSMFINKYIELNWDPALHFSEKEILMKVAFRM